MENIIIAAIVAGMVHSYITTDDKQEAFVDETNWQSIGNFSVKKGEVEWVMITDD
tara:strand:+ start:341 stop:505 length:165 start_codon:yes stop_codon:yes gene_type:complete